MISRDVFFAYTAAANGDMGALRFYHQNTLIKAMRHASLNVNTAEKAEERREGKKAIKTLNIFVKRESVNE